jgi:hypothetical protein
MILMPLGLACAVAGYLIGQNVNKKLSVIDWLSWHNEKGKFDDESLVPIAGLLFLSTRKTQRLSLLLLGLASVLTSVGFLSLSMSLR